MAAVEEAILEHSRIYLLSEFLPRIRAAVAQLSDEEVWWRPNEASNSVGNLLLHLSGNVRQWIVSGVGGAADVRQRDAEFETDRPVPTQLLLERLDQTVAEAAEVIGALPVDRLLESVAVQGRTVTVLEAIYHAVEHFSMHTGQILYIVKMRSGKDLGFYEVVDGIPRARWEGNARDYRPRPGDDMS